MDLSDICNVRSSDLESQYTALFPSNDTGDKDPHNQTLGLPEFVSSHKRICDRLWIENLVSWLVPLLFAIFVILGVVGNALVLIVIALYQQMRNTTNILILNLALSDLLLLTICIPPTAVDYAVGWPFGKGLCLIVQYLIHVTVYGSIYTLVLLSLDRYLAVVYPVQSISLRTVCNAFIIIGFTWVLAFASCSPIFFLFHTKTVSSLPRGDERNVCTFNRDEYSNTVEVVYQTLFFVTSLVIPILLIVSLYISMLHRLWRGTAATSGTGPARDKRCKGQENKRRVTRMIVFVIIAFILCWSPLQVVMLLKSFKLYEIDHTGLVAFQIICHCLAYCNSCLNPFLYAFLSSNFRNVFKKSIFCSRNRSGLSPESNRKRATIQKNMETVKFQRPSLIKENDAVLSHDTLELKNL